MATKFFAQISVFLPTSLRIFGANVQIRFCAWNMFYENYVLSVSISLSVSLHHDFEMQIFS